MNMPVSPTKALHEQHSWLSCFLLGLFCAFPLIFLTPPFQVPDEPQHFYRAYQISELNVISSLRNHEGGSVLPSSLIELSSHYLKSRSIHDARPVIKHSVSSISEGFQIPLNPGRREFIDFTGAAFYSPIPYLPQALGIAAGRALGYGPLALMYLSRLMNAAVAVFLLALAIRCAPVAKPVFLVAGLLPMSVYMYGSVSPDALVITSTYLFTALALRAGLRKTWSTPDLCLATVCATVFCSIKVVYAPLLLLALPAVFSGERRIRLLLIQAAIVLVPIALTGAWMHAVSGLVVPARAGTSVAMQAQHVIAHPLSFLEAVIHGFLWNQFYFFSMVGLLGWLAVTLPTVSYILPVAAGVIGLCTHEPGYSNNRIPVLLWWACLAMACVGLVMLALYCYWTPVAANVVEGIQGRYFIPVLPLFGTVIAGFLSMPGWALSRRRVLAWGACIMTVEACLTFYSLLEAYWLV